MINVIHSHDGAADDQMALLLLKTMKHVNLLGVVVMPADSILESALSITNYIADTTPVFVHDVKTPNRFPEEWREETNDISRLINEIAEQNPKSSETPRIPRTLRTRQFGIWELIEVIRHNYDITFIETGPLTVLADCIKLCPDISDHINHVIWTGGGFDDVPSKSIIQQYREFDGTQSWNALIDPISVKIVFDSKLKLTIFPRELTDSAKLTKTFYDNLPDTTNGRIYKQVYSKYLLMEFYRLWDVLTVSFVGCDIFQSEQRKLSVMVDGSSMGRTITSDIGRMADVVTKVNIDQFYTYLLNQLH